MIDNKIIKINIKNYFKFLKNKIYNIILFKVKFR